MSTPPAAPLRIALVGDHDPHITAHRAIPLALRLAGEALGLEILSLIHISEPTR
ncbi:hypothetical protein RBB72_26905, partial [Pseudomonas aeruginosa]|nr:hypothetical protein [Pseudomonas aeruginosa]